jgi:hypothetical protein
MHGAYKCEVERKVETSWAFLLALSQSIVRDMERHAPEPEPAALAWLVEAPGMFIERYVASSACRIPGAVRGEKFSPNNEYGVEVFANPLSS